MEKFDAIHGERAGVRLQETERKTLFLPRLVRCGVCTERVPEKVTGLLGIKKFSVLGSSILLGASDVTKYTMPGKSFFRKIPDYNSKIPPVQDTSSAMCKEPCMSFTVD